MNTQILELEGFFTKQMQLTVNLRNDLVTKELEKQDQLKEVALSILDILDSFERIEEGLIERGYDKVEEANKTINRYKNIQKKLLNLLQKYGVHKMEFPDNKLVIGMCEVVGTEPDATKVNDEIILIVRNGYVRGEEVIRNAQIIIAKN